MSFLISSIYNNTPMTNLVSCLQQEFEYILAMHEQRNFVYGKILLISRESHTFNT